MEHVGWLLYEAAVGRPERRQRDSSTGHRVLARVAQVLARQSVRAAACVRGVEIAAPGVFRHALAACTSIIEALDEHAPHRARDDARARIIQAGSPTASGEHACARLARGRVAGALGRTRVVRPSVGCRSLGYRGHVASAPGQEDQHAPDCARRPSHGSTVASGTSSASRERSSPGQKLSDAGATLAQYRPFKLEMKPLRPNGPDERGIQSTDDESSSPETVAGTSPSTGPLDLAIDWPMLRA